MKHFNRCVAKQLLRRSVKRPSHGADLIYDNSIIIDFTCDNFSYNKLEGFDLFWFFKLKKNSNCLNNRSLVALFTTNFYLSIIGFLTEIRKHFLNLFSFFRQGAQ